MVKDCDLPLKIFKTRKFVAILIMHPLKKWCEDQRIRNTIGPVRLTPFHPHRPLGHDTRGTNVFPHRYIILPLITNTLNVGHCGKHQNTHCEIKKGLQISRLAWNSACPKPSCFGKKEHHQNLKGNMLYIFRSNYIIYITLK